MKTLLAVMIAVLFTLTAGPASAADDKIGLSRDGQTFTSTIPPIFDPNARLVPGDHLTRTFYVRNQAAESGRLVVAIKTASGDLIDRDVVTISAASASRSGAAVQPRSGVMLLENLKLKPGGVAPITIAVDFPFESGNDTQLRVGELTFSVRMEQASPTATKPDPKGNGILPDTGSPISMGVLLGAAALLGGGLALMRRRRDEEEGNDA